MPRHPAPAPDDRARRLPRAVLWDMDGTLVDTEPLWNAVQRRLVEEHGGRWMNIVRSQQQKSFILTKLTKSLVRVNLVGP